MSYNYNNLLEINDYSETRKMGYPSEFYYTEKSNEPSYDYIQSGGKFAFNKIMQSEPYWMHDEAPANVKKTLIIADWTLASHSYGREKQRFEQIKTRLEKLLKDGFTLYLWQEGSDFLPLNKENLDCLDKYEIIKRITPADDAIMQKKALDTLGLTKDKIHIVDDYWLDDYWFNENKLENNSVRPARKLKFSILKSASYSAHGPYFEMNRILDVLTKKTPPLSFIVHDTFSSEDNNAIQKLRNQIIEASVTFSFGEESQKSLNTSYHPSLGGIVLTTRCEHLHLVSNQVDTLVNDNEPGIALSQLGKVKSIYLNNYISASNNALGQLLTAANRVEEITIDNCHINDSIANDIHLNELKKLSIINSTITPDALEKLIAKATNLEKLVFKGPYDRKNITKVEIPALRPLPLLKHLVLRNCNIAASSLQNLIVNAPGLKHLILEVIKIDGRKTTFYATPQELVLSRKITADVANLITHVSEFESLVFRHVKIEENFKIPRNLALCKNLSITHCRISSANFVRLLENVSNLESLGIGGHETKIKWEIPSLISFAFLREIKFFDTTIEFNTLNKLITSAKNLDQLTLDYIEIEGKIEKSLYSSNCKSLSLHNCAMTADHFQNLLMSVPNIKKLKLSGIIIIIGKLDEKKLPRLEALEVLDLDTSFDGHESSLQSILNVAAKVIKKSPRIKKLSLHPYSKFSRLPHIQALDLEELLSLLPEMETLSLDCNIKGKLNRINLKRLKNLELDSFYLNIENLAVLTAGAPNLEELNIRYSQLDQSKKGSILLSSIKKLKINYSVISNSISKLLHSINEIMPKLEELVLLPDPDLDLGLIPKGKGPWEIQVKDLSQEQYLALWRDAVEKAIAKTLDIEVKEKNFEKLLLNAPNIKRVHTNFATLLPLPLSSLDSLAIDGISNQVLNLNLFNAFATNLPHLFELTLNTSFTLPESVNIDTLSSLKRLVLKNMAFLIEDLEGILNTTPNLNFLHLESVSLKTDNFDRVINRIKSKFPHIKISGLFVEFTQDEHYSKRPNYRYNTSRWKKPSSKLPRDAFFSRFAKQIDSICKTNRKKSEEETIAAQFSKKNIKEFKKNLFNPKNQEAAKAALKSSLEISDPTVQKNVTKLFKQLFSDPHNQEFSQELLIDQIENLTPDTQKNVIALLMNLFSDLKYQETINKVLKQSLLNPNPVIRENVTNLFDQLAVSKTLQEPIKKILTDVVSNMDPHTQKDIFSLFKKLLSNFQFADQAKEVLQGGLTHENTVVRENMTALFNQVSSDPQFKGFAKKALLDILSDSDPTIQKNVVSLIKELLSNKQMIDEIKEALSTTMDNQNPAAQGNIANLFKELWSDSQCRRFIKNTISDVFSDKTVRKNAVSIFKKFLSHPELRDQAKKILVSNIFNTNRKIKKNATELQSQLKDEDLLEDPTIEEPMIDADMQVLLKSLFSDSKLKKYAKKMLAIKKDGALFDQLFVSSRLQTFVTQVLLDSISSSKPKNKHLAASLWGHITSKQLLQEYVRNAIKQLLEANYSESLIFVIKQLSDPDPVFQKNAIILFNQFSSDSELQALSKEIINELSEESYRALLDSTSIQFAHPDPTVQKNIETLFKQLSDHPFFQASIQDAVKQSSETGPSRQKDASSLLVQLTTNPQFKEQAQEAISQLSKKDYRVLLNNLAIKLSNSHSDSQNNVSELLKKLASEPKLEEYTKDWIAQLSQLDLETLRNIAMLIQNPLSFSSLKLYNYIDHFVKQLPKLDDRAQQILKESCIQLLGSFDHFISSTANQPENAKLLEEIPRIKKEILRFKEAFDIQEMIPQFEPYFETWKKAKSDLSEYVNRLSKSNPTIKTDEASLLRKAYCQLIVGGGSDTSERKRLIELTSTRDVNAMSLLLQDYCQSIGRPIFYAHSPSDLICSAPYVERKGENGIMKKGPGGPLHTFLTNPYNKDMPPLLLVNFERFLPNDIVRFNTMLDGKRSVDGTAIPEDCIIVGLTNINHPNVYQESDFYSRLDVVEACLLEKDIFTAPRHMTSCDAHDKEAYYTIDLYHGSDWKEELLGKWTLKKDKLLFKPGKLEKALQSGQPIEIKNGLWDNENFRYFWDQAFTLKRIGEWNVESVRWVKSEGYDWDNLKKRVTFTNAIQKNATVLNPTQFNQFFERYQCDDVNYTIDTLSGILEDHADKSLHINLTRSLNHDQWARLLQGCETHKVVLHVHCAPGVILPSELSHTIASAPEYSVWRDNTASISVSYSNDVSTTAALLAKDELWQVIDVSECNASDLLTKLSGHLNKETLGFDFQEQSGALNRALAENKNIILKGKFSAELADALAPTLLSELKSTGKLRLVCENPSVFDYVPGIQQHQVSDAEQERVLVEIFKFKKDEIKALPKTKGESLDHWRARLVDKRIYQTSDSNRPWYGLNELPGHIRLTPFDANRDPADIAKNAEIFIKKRRADVNAVFQEAPYAILAGLTGVGKSAFIENNLADQEPIDLYFGKNKIAEWASQPSEHLKVLVIDEANIGNEDYSEFEGLFNKQPSVFCRDNGTVYPITDKCKVVFLINPKKDSDNRKTPSLFEHHGNTIVFDPLSTDFIYEYVLKPIFNDTILMAHSLPISEKLLNVYQFLCECSKDYVLISPRELQMMLILTLTYCEKNKDSNPITVAQHYAYQIGQGLVPEVHKAAFEQFKPAESIAPLPLLPIVNDTKQNYVVTASREPLYQQINELLTVRQYRRDHVDSLNDEQLFGGLGGIVIEGNPGIGKSELVNYILQRVPPDEICRIPASLGKNEKREKLIEALKEGKIIIMDEINSSNMMEKELNDITMGKSPDEKDDPLSHEPGLIILGTQNPSRRGRKKESNAAARRMLKANLSDYTLKELSDIWIARGVEPLIAKAFSQAYLNKYNEAIKNDYKPEPTMRNMETIAYRLKLIEVPKEDIEEKIIMKENAEPSSIIEKRVEEILILTNKATSVEDELIKELKSICDDYQTNLQNRLMVPKISDHKKRWLENKNSKLQILQSILVNDKDYLTSKDKLNAFSDQFVKSKNDFKKDSDPVSLQFIKAVGRILAAALSLGYAAYRRKQSLEKQQLTTQGFWANSWKSKESWERKTFETKIKPLIGPRSK